jgi:benzoyl-CoA reductase subunit C
VPLGRPAQTGKAWPAVGGWIAQTLHSSHVVRVPYEARRKRNTFPGVGCSVNSGDHGFEALVAECRALVEDLSYPRARRWRKEHPDGRVLGHFQVYFPEEVAHAAGVLPVSVMGAGSAIDARRADSRIGSFVCSICRTSLELGMANHLDFLDEFVTHPICDGARHMAGLWGRNLPRVRSQILYLPQNANSPYAPLYLRDEYRRLLHELEEATGRTVSEADLRRSIRLYNENRRRIRDLYAVKRTEPWRLGAGEAYVLVRAGTVMPREEHNEILTRALDLLQQREGRKKDRLRVVFSGGFCEQPPLELLSTIEESCYVVDDDLLIGARWIVDDVPEAGDPLLALAESYLHRSAYSPVQHDERKPKEEMLLAQMRAAGADAAILAVAKMCEPGLDEQVAYQKALDQAGIPYLLVEFEEKMTAFEQVRMQVETFVEAILFD